MQKKSLKSASSKQRGNGGRKALQTLGFFGSEFVLNTETGMFYRVTPMAILLLQAIQQGADSGALAELVQQHCAVSRMTAVRDVELLINELSVRGILTSNPPESVR